MTELEKKFSNAGFVLQVFAGHVWVKDNIGHTYFSFYNDRTGHAQAEQWLAVNQSPH